MMYVSLCCFNAISVLSVCTLLYLEDITHILYTKTNPRDTLRITKPDQEVAPKTFCSLPKKFNRN